MESIRYSDLDDTAALVSTFNSLPRSKLAPSGLVPNHWHISLRHIPLTPPGKIIFFISPASRYVHSAGPLPPDIDNESKALQATVWVILMLKAFNTGLVHTLHEEGNIVAKRPWSWVCNDAEMAGAVGEKLREMGVTAPVGISVAEEEENRIADEGWESLFAGLRQQMGNGR